LRYQSVRGSVFINHYLQLLTKLMVYVRR